MDFSFSENMYDKDGDAFDYCVIAHFGSCMLRFENAFEMKLIAERMLKAAEEIEPGVTSRGQL
jgi:hypothetical protein